MSDGRAPVDEEVPQLYLFPASRAQYQLYFVQHLLGDAPTYHISLRCELHGRIDEQAMRCALTLIVRRHEALRTHFVLSEGESLQAVDPDGTLEYLARDDSEAAWLDEEARKPFDLETGPLFGSDWQRHEPGRATQAMSP
ncbi:condensation domain-containing protein [Saccharomonospora saliphila]|uniref:condensation domain-containing protein n=1 Tax=Saccharomonospora saliphila TaxID=369829 RepID=UPI00039FC7D9|nr:condensation domain-containing protein [Saccharomonospora saliphila]